MPLSRSTKVVAISAAVGLAVIGLLAIYFRRKKPDKKARKRLPLRSEKERTRYASLSSIKSPLNGEISRSAANSAHSGSPAPMSKSDHYFLRAHSREPSEVASSVGTLVGMMPMDMADGLMDPVDRSPAHLCQLGLEAIQRAINLWEAAISEIDERSQDGRSEVHDLRHQIEQMVERALLIQEEYERIMFHQSTTVALDSALAALSDMNRIYEREHRTGDETESDTESFVSASEMPDLSDIDDHIKGAKMKMYEDALFAVKNGAVPYRVLRTKMLSCSSDADFLAKLHCVRLAFGVLMSEEKNRDYFTTTGRDILVKMIRLSGKETSDFETAFDSLMVWVKSPTNWAIMEQELRGRGVKAFTFYDVVLDFILMDSFDDLASPPSSVTTITHNRWLSDKFKETALTTAVWSVLKAKRRMLGSSNGFIAKFYDVSEIISPTLAWGFLGPIPDLNDLCYFFKDLVCDFISDIFDLQRVSYANAVRLADDIMRVGRERAAEAAARMVEHEEFLVEEKGDS